MRAIVIAAALGLAGLGLSPSRAAAHEPTPYRHPGFGSSFGGYYGGYYGRHDTRPHWHRTYTPYGVYEWYGLGSHDFRPHTHVRTPFETRSYSVTPWGVTESIHPRYRAYPYYYGP